MISVILFVAACLVWQVIKDIFRGGKREHKPIVSMGTRRAECGCELLGNQVSNPCVSHLTMLSALRRGK